MTYVLLADALVAVHAAFILFALLGASTLVRWPRLVWLHLPALAWGAWIEFSGNYCPLTPLENAWREQGGEAGYDGGFVDRYVTPVIYPDGLTHDTQLIYGAILIGLNLLFYARFVAARRR